jgi:hypothetical protein
MAGGGRSHACQTRYGRQSLISSRGRFTPNESSNRGITTLSGNGFIGKRVKKILVANGECGSTTKQNAAGDEQPSINYLICLYSI